MGTRRRGRRGAWRISWLALLLEAAMPSPVRAGELTPQDRHFAALEQARDCSVYRAVAQRAKSEGEGHRRALAAVKKLLAERRAALERCAEANGIRGVDTEDEDRVLAEACNREYVEWLAPGYRLRILQEDLRESRDAVATLAAVAQYRCGGLKAPAFKTAAVAPDAEALVSPLADEGDGLPDDSFTTEYPVGAPSREALLDGEPQGAPAPVETSADRAARGNEAGSESGRERTTPGASSGERPKVAALPASPPEVSPAQPDEPLIEMELTPGAGRPSSAPKTWRPDGRP